MKTETIHHLWRGYNPPWSVTVSPSNLQLLMSAFHSSIDLKLRRGEKKTRKLVLAHVVQLEKSQPSRRSCKEGRSSAKKTTCRYSPCGNCGCIWAAICHFPCPQIRTSTPHIPARLHLQEALDTQKRAKSQERPCRALRYQLQ